MRSPTSTPFLRGCAVALVVVSGCTIGLAPANADGGDQTIVNVYAKPVARHPKVSDAVQFSMLSFSEANGKLTTTYTATIRIGVPSNGRPARALVSKTIKGSTNGSSKFSVRLSAKDRRVLRAAAAKAKRRTVIAEIQPTPTGTSTGGKRVGERRDWPLLTR